MGDRRGARASCPLVISSDRLLVNRTDSLCRTTDWKERR